WQPADWNKDFRQLPTEGEVTGVCIAASESQEILSPPLPFTLSALLANAADIGIDLPSGYAAVQKLYEAGAISYPRTSSTKMPGAGAGFAVHHAIINTMDCCPEWMPIECQTIFNMVHHNCVLQQIGAAKLHVRKLLFDLGGEMFSATDYWADPLEPNDEAWLLCEPDQLDTLERNVKTVMFKPGEQVNATLLVERTRTVPPERYTEAGLLRHMAEAEIGTEATRVDAINNLVKDQVVERRQVKTKCSLELSPTEKGMHLIDRLPPSVTGHTMDTQLRNALNYVRTGQVDFAGHLLNASKWLSLTINGLKNASNEF
ncbi:MAG: hypothetical protein KJ899_00765, partial [Gammaproteobacteria bacterium]|nr:hypothetical protein [Gammaproteobacteria bacterium]